MIDNFNCLKCGNCLFYCPVYNVEKEEPFSPRGRLSLIELLEDNDFPKFRKRFLQECLLCGSCEKNCSANIKITDIYIKNRVIFKKDSPPIKKIALSFFNKNILNIYKHLFFIKYIPFVKLPKYNLSFKNKSYKSSKKVILFSGCVANYIITEIKDSAIFVLNNMGYEVIIPEFNCCGFPFLSSGDNKKFELLKKENLEILQRYPDIPVIILCPTGLHTFKEYYKFKKIYEFAEFVFKNKKFLKFLNSITLKERISVHIPCHYLNFYDSPDIMENLLENIKGLDIFQPEQQKCCGFGGTFAATYPKISNKILKKAIDNLKADEGRKIITNCPGCTIQLSKEKETIHLAILLARIILENNYPEISTISKE